MSDETVESSATATETTAEAVTEEAAAPAEAENTETTPAKEAATEPKGPIPYDRFAQVNDQKKEAIERAETLEKELAEARAAKPAEAVVPSVELTEPPEHLSQREKVDFYVRQSARNMIREELGMDLGQAKTLLEAVPSVSDATYEQQWQRMCEAKGLDPTDRTIQDLTRGLVKGSGHEPEDALNVVADLVGKKAAVTTVTPPQRMETDATTGTLTDKSVELVFDKSAARKLAEQGKRAPLMSAVDILKAAESKRKAAG